MVHKNGFNDIKITLMPLFYIKEYPIHKTNNSEAPEYPDQREANNSVSWYRTLYAEILISLLLFSLIIGFVFVLVYRQRKLNRMMMSDKIASENRKSKMDFLTIITHELHNPLSLIISQAEDLKNNFNTLDEQWRIHIDMIYHNSRNVEKLVNQIINFNESDAGKLKLPESDSNLSELIREETSNIEENYQFRNYENIDRIQNHSTNENEEKLKALLAVEYDELRDFLVHVFSMEYECYASGDGIEAYHLINEIMPAVIISDAVMPGIDGYKLCRMVKDNLSTSHIPVLLIIAQDADEQIISAFNNGADAYIVKPIGINIMLSQVSRMIRNRELIKEKYLTKNFMVETANSLISKDDEFILRLRMILDENIADTDFNVSKLSKQMNMSTTQLYRKLKTLTGYSPVKFIHIIKLQKACELLNQRKNTIKEVCYLVGFNNLSYFVKCFREFFGVTPAVYRDQGLTETAKAETNKEL